MSQTEIATQYITAVSGACAAARGTASRCYIQKSQNIAQQPQWRPHHSCSCDSNVVPRAAESAPERPKGWVPQWLRERLPAAVGGVPVSEESEELTLDSELVMFVSASLSLSLCLSMSLPLYISLSLPLGIASGSPDAGGQATTKPSRCESAPQAVPCVPL